MESFFQIWKCADAPHQLDERNIVDVNGIFHKIFHKMISYLNRLTINTRLFSPKIIISLFASEYSCFLSIHPTAIESELAHNTTATLIKLAGTNYVDSGNCQMSRQLWTNSLVKKFLLLLERETQSVQKRGKQRISIGTKLTLREADFNQFTRLKNQLVVAVRDFSKEENLPLCKWNW